MFVPLCAGTLTHLSSGQADASGEPFLVPVLTTASQCGPISPGREYTTSTQSKSLQHAREVRSFPPSGGSEPVTLPFRDNSVLHILAGVLCCRRICVFFFFGFIIGVGGMVSFWGWETNFYQVAIVSKLDLLII